MKISYNWLKDFIQTDLSINKISDILTDIGLEVEGVEKTGITAEDLEGFVVGKVVSCQQHPNADKLKVTQVDLGTGVPVQIVCGAPNVAEGQTVLVATIGAKLSDGKGNEFSIKPVKLRGEKSNGMICSKKELGLGEDHSGIWAMDENEDPGTPLSQVIKTESDSVFEIGLTPNRADAMSHFGVARDLYAAIKSRKITPTLSFTNELINIDTISDKEVESPFKVTVEEPELCPRYSGIYLKDIEVKESPEWMQTRLSALGLSPINNVVDITNYVLHGWGQPMHAFDAAKIPTREIVVKKAKKGEKFTTLDKVERTLNGDELMITDGNTNLGIAGVMGGLDSAVDENTVTIFLESAYFNRVTVRKTSKAHNINSDSSFRFERGIDPNFPVDALAIAVNLLQKYANATVVGDYVDIYPNPIKDFSVVLPFHKVDQLIGERIHRDKIKEILTLLDIEIISEVNSTLDLNVPPFRVDVQRGVDVIEEILRIYGYNTVPIPEKLNSALVAGEGYEKNKIQKSLSNQLVSQGFYEAMNMSMYNKEFNTWMNFDEKNSVELLNSLSADLAVMRRSLLPGLLQNISYNNNRKTTNVKLFEWGKVYAKNGETFKENSILSLALSGDIHHENWAVPTEAVSFNYLKGLVEQVLNRLNIKQLTTKSQSNANYSELLEIWNEDLDIALIGKVNNELTKKFDVEQDVYYAEFNIENIEKARASQKPMLVREISKYQSVRRDLALLLDKNVSYQDIVNSIEQLNEPKLVDINLFDVYEGDKLPNDKKSYAISFMLQDPNKTMKDQEIDEVMSNFTKALKQNLNAELRT